MTPRVENLTMTGAELAACKPIAGEGGYVLRALCPFHGSDRQRSLRVQVHSGRFVCFACGAWGYMETARAQWREEQQRQVSALQADFSGPSHAWLSSNLALKVVRSARAVSWAVPHPRSLQRLVGYLGGDHNARA